MRSIDKLGYVSQSNSIAVASVLGKKSSANPLQTGVSAFVRNIIGGLMR